jgi:hypothetical protein
VNKWRENRSTWSEKCDDKTTLKHLVGTMNWGDIVLDDLERPQNGIWVQGSDEGQTGLDFSLSLPFTHGFESQKG